MANKKKPYTGEYMWYCDKTSCYKPKHKEGLCEEHYAIKVQVDKEHYAIKVQVDKIKQSDWYKEFLVKPALIHK